MFISPDHIEQIKQNSDDSAITKDIVTGQKI